MRLSALPILMLASVAAIAACDHRAPTAPNPALARANTGSSGGDTATHGSGNGGGHLPPTDSATKTDSGSSTYHGPVHLTVSVVAYVTQAGTNGDSLALTGVANALVEASLVTPAGVGPALQLGHTNAHGVLDAGTVPAGSYIIRATPPSGSSDAAQVSVLLDRPVLTVQIAVRSGGGS